MYQRSGIKHQRFKSKFRPIQKGNYFLAFLMSFLPLFPSILLKPFFWYFKSKRYQSTLSFCNAIAECRFSRHNLEICKPFCCQSWSCLHRAQTRLEVGTGLFPCCVSVTPGQQLLAWLSLGEEKNTQFTTRSYPAQDRVRDMFPIPVKPCTASGSCLTPFWGRGGWYSGDSIHPSGSLTHVCEFKS